MRPLIWGICLILISTMAYSQSLTIPTTSFQYPSGIAGKEVNFSINSNGWFTINNLNMTARVYGFNSFTLGVDVNDNGKFGINIRNNDATPKQLLLALIINITPTMNVRWQGKDCTNGVCTTAVNPNPKSEIIIDNRINLEYGDILPSGYGIQNVTATPRILNITITNNLTTAPNGIAVIDPVFSTTSLGSSTIIPLNESAHCIVYCDNTNQDLSMTCQHQNGDVLRSEADLDTTLGACDNSNQVAGFVWEENGNLSIIYYDGEPATQDVTLITGNWTSIVEGTTPIVDLDTAAGTVGVSVTACRLNNTAGAYSWFDDGATTESILTHVRNRNTAIIGSALTVSSGDQNTEDHTLIGSDCLTNVTWAIGWSNTAGNTVLARTANITGGTVAAQSAIVTAQTTANDARVGIARYNNTAYYVCWVDNGVYNDTACSMYSSNGVKIWGNITVDNNVDATSFVQLYMNALPNGNASMIYRDGLNQASAGDTFTGIKIAQISPENYSQVFQVSPYAVSYLGFTKQSNLSIQFCNNSIVYTDDRGFYNGTNSNGGNWSGKCATSSAENSCTYSSGDFNINCADNCQITSTADLNQNKVRFYGSGTIDITGKIFDYSTLVNEGSACYVACRSPSGECFA